MNILRQNSAIASWILALTSTSSSLYFSEIRHFVPCILCWYQRIIMYPLVVIIAVAILKKDKNLPYFVLPFSILGILVSSYHNLLYFGVIPEAVSPCYLGVSCTAKFIQLLGFIDIPLLSLGAFTMITLLMLLLLRTKKS